MISAEQNNVLRLAGKQYCEMYINEGNESYFIDITSPIIQRYLIWEQMNQDFRATDSVSRIQFFNAFYEGWKKAVEEKILKITAPYSRTFDDLLKANRIHDWQIKHSHQAVIAPDGSIECVICGELLDNEAAK